MENYIDPTIAWFSMWADAKTLWRRVATRRWRKKNPEKNRVMEEKAKNKSREQNPAKWRARNAAHVKRWRIANAERERPKAAARMKKWREKNAAHHSAYRRAHYTKNAAKIKAAVRQWRIDNHDAWAAQHASSDARRPGAEGHFKRSDIDRLWDAQEGLCVYCSADLAVSINIDHKLPIIRGGTNWPDNLQLTCESCNKRKHSMTDDEFRALMAA